MSETWLHDNDSAIITAVTLECYVLHQVSHPDKKGGGVGCRIKNALKSKK